MFVWGRGQRSRTAKLHDGSTTCLSCGAAYGQDLQVEYEFKHIFWVFRGVKNEQYTTVCGECGGVNAVDRTHGKQLVSKAKRNPIPFMDRYGAYILLLIVAGWVAYALAFPCSVNPSSDLCRQSQRGSTNGP